MCFLGLIWIKQFRCSSVAWTLERQLFPPILLRTDLIILMVPNWKLRAVAEGDVLKQEFAESELVSPCMRVRLSCVHDHLCLRLPSEQVVK